MKERCRRALFSQYTDYFFAEGMGSVNDKVSVLASMNLVFEALLQEDPENTRKALAMEMLDEKITSKARGNAVIDVPMDDSVM